MSDSRIRERMEVIGADGVHVGTVDKVENGRIKLTRAATPATTTSSRSASWPRSKATRSASPPTPPSPSRWNRKTPAAPPDAPPRWPRHARGQRQAARPRPAPAAPLA